MMLILDAGAKRSAQKQAAHLLSQMGGCIAIRHHGGITPEAELSLATRALLLTRLSSQISLRNLRKLDCYANRYPLRLKTLSGQPCCGWSVGGVGRVLCCDMNWSNSSLSLA
jgi:hypothetical protein